MHSSSIDFRQLSQAIGLSTFSELHAEDERFGYSCQSHPTRSVEQPHPLQDPEFFDSEAQWIECRNSADVPSNLLGKLVVISGPYRTRQLKLGVISQKINYTCSNFFYWYEVVDDYMAGFEHLPSTARKDQSFKIRLPTIKEEVKLKNLLKLYSKKFYLGTSEMGDTLPTEFPFKEETLNQEIPSDL